MLFVRHSSKNYTLLSRLSEAESIDHVSTPSGTHKGRFIDWVTALILICGFIDTAALAILAYLRFRASAVSSHATSPQDLPFRSSYVGLEDLYAQWEGKWPRYHPITNLPQLVAQADTSSESRKTMEQEPKYVRTNDGMILLDDRHFLVRPEVRIDHSPISHPGMERCDLMITFPDVAGGESGTYLAPDVVEVDVWKLKTDKVLEMKINTEIRAPRIALLNSIHATYGSNISMPFECKSGSLHTFEFTSNGEAKTKASKGELIGEWSDPRKIIKVETVAS